MEVLAKFISFFQFEMTEPTIYSWFHILSIIIMFLLIIYLIYKRPNTKKFLFTFSIIMLLLEVYKQLSFTFSDEPWRYHWYSFPFQFCSTPMYIAFIASLTKNKKLEKNCYAFLATYGVIAGLSVMAYPITVFVREVLINIQTMIHHGFMVIMGVYLIVNNDVEPNFKTLIDGTKVFLCLAFIALTTDIITYYIGLDNGLELFYISPYHVSILPVFSIIYSKVPYPVFLLIYLIVFAIGAYIPLLVYKPFFTKQNKKISNLKQS